MSEQTNPGPGIKYCPHHGNVWLHAVNPVYVGGVTLSSDAEYEIRCGICGALLVDKIDWNETTENID
jgi:hypothetical protein